MCPAVPGTAQGQVRVQHREQLTRRAGHLPAQWHPQRAPALDGLRALHPGQLGVLDRLGQLPGVQAVLVGGLRRDPQGTVADEDRQPAAGRPEWRPHRDLTNREHLLTVPAGERGRSGTKVPPRTDEGPLAQLTGWPTVSARRTIRLGFCAAEGAGAAPATGSCP